MASKGSVKIISKKPLESSSSIIIDNVSYQVQTEDLGKKLSRIASRVYDKGEIVFSRDSDYSHLLNISNFGERLRGLIENQHKTTIDLFTKEQSAKQKQKSQYFDEVKTLLKRGSGEGALTLLEEALAKFPGDPFLMSYYGCLIAIVRNKSREGISVCQEAIKRLDQTMPFGREFFYPVFYLNLGRAYLKAGRKKDAVNAFFNGIKNDPDNPDIHEELVALGTRRKLPVPFLTRSNPVNKYIGLLTSKTTKK